MFQKLPCKSLLALTTSLALAGCFGGSSDSNGNGGDNGNGSSGNGDAVSVEPTSSDWLFYAFETVGVTAGDVGSLVAVDPNDPQTETQIIPHRQDNARQRSDEEIFRSSDNENEADPSTFPLGLKTGVWNDGTLTDIHFPRVIYNSEAGELFAVDATTDGEPTAQRISTETDAEVVCAAQAFADYQDLKASVIVYQVPSENLDCGTTDWRMVRLGDDDQTEPRTLRSDIEYEGGFTPDEDQITPRGFREHWAIPVRDSDGGMVSVLTFDGDDTENVRWHDPVTGNDEILASSVDTWVRPLGVAGTDHRPVLHINGALYAIDTASELNGNERLIAIDTDGSGVNETRIEKSLTGPEHAVNIDGILYVVDIGFDEDDSGRIIAVDPDKDTNRGTVLAEDWSTSCMLGAVTGTSVGSGYVAWMYFDDCDDGNSGVARHLALDGSQDSYVLKDNLAFDFPARIQSPEAPGDTTPLMFYNRGTRSWAGAIDITGAGGGYELENAAWLGQTWNRDQTEIGRRAEYLFYLEDDSNNNSILKARAADDATGETVVTFDNAPDPGVVNRVAGDVFAGSYGPETLLGIRPSILPPATDNNLQGTIWFADPRDPASMQELRSSIGYTARPVSYY